MRNPVDDASDASFPASDPPSWTLGSTPSNEIAIVGAGLTGLALAHEMARSGAELTVLEAAERPGGVIRSERVGSHLVEWGPQRMRLSGPVKALIEDLGLENEVITAAPNLPLYVYRSGKLRRVPFSVAEFLATDLLTWAGKMRVLAEPLTRGPKPTERVADYFTRKFGRAAYENMLGPLYGGLYASDPADMVLDQSLAPLLRQFGVERSMLLPLLKRGGRGEAPPATSFPEGLQTLTDALYDAHRARIRLDTPVTGLKRGDGEWILETGDRTVGAATVVLTTPAAATAAILRGAAPEAAERIGGLQYNPLAVVHLHADARLVGLGYQVSLAEDLATRGVTFNDSLFGRSGVYTAFLGGAKAPWIRDLPDEEVAAIAAREFEQVTGEAAEPIRVVRAKMPAWDHTWSALDGLELPDGIRVAANWQARPGIPGRLAQAARLARELTR